MLPTFGRSDRSEVMCIHWEYTSVTHFREIDESAPHFWIVMLKVFPENFDSPRTFHVFLHLINSFIWWLMTIETTLF